MHNFARNYTLIDLVSKGDTFKFKINLAISLRQFCPVHHFDPCGFRLYFLFTRKGDSPFYATAEGFYKTS